MLALEVLVHDLFNLFLGLGGTELVLEAGSNLVGLLALLLLALSIHFNYLLFNLPR